MLLLCSLDGFWDGSPRLFCRRTTYILCGLGGSIQSPSFHFFRQIIAMAADVRIAGHITGHWLAATSANEWRHILERFTFPMIRKLPVPGYARIRKRVSRPGSGPRGPHSTGPVTAGHWVRATGPRALAGGDPSELSPPAALTGPSPQAIVRSKEPSRVAPAGK